MGRERDRKEEAHSWLTMSLLSVGNRYSECVHTQYMHTAGLDQ